MSDALSDETKRFLESLGADLAELPDDPLALGGFAFDLAFATGHQFTMPEVADAAGVDLEMALELYRMLGISLESSARVYSTGDVELIRTMSESIEGPFDAEEGGQILRVAARALTSIAEASVAEVRQRVEVRQENVDDTIRAMTSLGTLGIRLGDGIGVAFRHHLRLAVDRQRFGQQGVRERELIRLAVGFVDLVGFTGLTANLPVEELVRLVDSLERRASELGSKYDVRIVKMIGDEVMFVGFDPALGCQFALELLGAFGEDRLVGRGSVVYGDVLFRHGDFYGPVVNRASRIADLAVPGEVLVDAATASVADVITTPAGRRVLRGFDEPVEVFALT